MPTYEEIKKANEAINTTDIKGKEYAEVHQRIKAFRMVYPEGCIKTEMLSIAEGVCVIRAYVYAKYYETPNDLESSILLGTGTAYEKEGSSFINKTSYIENCETSAVGRALGMCGFGIDTSVASAEEVQNAMLNQPLEKKYINSLKSALNKAGKAPTDVEALHGCVGYGQITFRQYQDAMKELGAE